MHDENKKETHDGEQKDLQNRNQVAGQKARAAGGKSDSGGHVDSQSNREWTPGLFLEGETPESRRAGRPRESDSVRREKEDRTCAVTRASEEYFADAPNTDMCTCGHDRSLHAHGFHNATQQHVWHHCDNCRCMHFVLENRLRRKLDDSKDVCACGHKRSHHGRVILQDTIIDTCSGGDNICQCDSWKIAARGEA